MVKPEDTLSDIRAQIAHYNMPEHRLSVARSNAMSLIARHDMEGVRGILSDALSSVAPIMYGSTFRNNTTVLKDEFADNKLEYLKLFRFNICPENSSCVGYITEKIFESIMAGCIPIYYGGAGHVEPDILNPEAFIYYDGHNLDAVVEQVRTLCEDEDAYREFASRPPFLPGAASAIYQYMEQLEYKLRHI